MIAIVGSGRVARSLGRLLVDRGDPVAAVAARSPDRAESAARFIGPAVRPLSLDALAGVADRLLVAVSDDAIECVAQRLASSGVNCGVALHTCGAFGPEALEPLASAGVRCGALHPLQTIATAEQGLTALPGCTFGITADAEALEWALHITGLLHGHPLVIAPAQRPLYHAAAVIAGNYPAALLSAAAALLADAGIDSVAATNALTPLAAAAMQNIATLGLTEAVTGPVVRGDIDTIARHLVALRQARPAIAQLYIAACWCLLPIAAARGVSGEAIRTIEDLLGTETEEDEHD